jgi:hypothetical protein
LFQGGAGARQRVGEAAGGVHEGGGGVAGDGQRGRDLLDQGFTGRQHPMVGVLLVLDGTAGGQLGDGGQLACLRPGGLPPRRRHRLDQLGVVQLA